MKTAGAPSDVVMACGKGVMGKSLRYRIDKSALLRNQAQLYIALGSISQASRGERMIPNHDTRIELYTSKAYTGEVTLTPSHGLPHLYTLFFLG